MSNNTIYQSGNKNKATIKDSSGRGPGFWISVIIGAIVALVGGVAVGYILFTLGWN